MCNLFQACFGDNSQVIMLTLLISQSCRGQHVGCNINCDLALAVFTDLSHLLDPASSINSPEHHLGLSIGAQRFSTLPSVMLPMTPPLSNMSTYMKPAKHFVCALCDRAFQRPAELERHKRTHTGEKPYSCGFCQKPFTTTSNRNAHMKVCFTIPGKHKQAQT